MNKIEKKDDGLYWPIIDRNGCYDWTYGELFEHKIIADACNQKRSIIHAGANVGVYTMNYSKIFQNVYAIEPHPVNFQCLKLNTIECENVFLYHAALGNKNEPIALNELDSNCGAYTVIGKGVIPQFKIDDFGLDDVDCIHLDVEGFEPLALLGAEKTIQKTSPIIAIEWMDHSSQFGWSQQNILDLMIKFGYNNMMKVSSSMVFKK